MGAVPREGTFDSTLAMLKEGYPFISNRCDRLGSDLFETRLMLSQVVCMRGSEAARLFYEPDRFTRKGAIPKSTLKLLQDEGSVQQLDGPAHRRRKALFLSLMGPEESARLAALMAAEWRGRAPRWTGRRVVLLDEAQEILLRAACLWAGVPLEEEEAPRRAREFAAMVDGAGSVGPRNWRGALLRRRTERWARALIRAARAGGPPPPSGSALAAVAGADDIDETTAAVELINVLRPVVAVAWYIVFAALALRQHPGEARALEPDDPDGLERFVQEVRRLSPFFPFVGGRVLKPFDWRGRRFEAGEWALLDIYGTNRDPRIWDEPDAFRPDRFRSWDGDANSLIPQGAGEPSQGHRCPGERPTIELMKAAVRLLAGEMSYEVPPQDLAVSLSRMPAVPASRFVIANARLR